MPLHPGTALYGTPAFQAWLGRFDAEDQTAARVLVAGLRIVPDGELSAAIERKVLEAVGEQAPAALFAAREVEWGVPYFPDRKTQPARVAPNVPVGSEGDLAHLTRDLAKRHKGTLLDHPSLDEMAAARVRRIVVVNDSLGSGDQVARFVRWLLRDKTVRSWRSYKFVDFAAAVCAATTSGKGVVAEEAAVFSEYVVPTGRDSFRDDEYEMVKRLCEKYAGKCDYRHWPLGYEGAFTLLVFPHKAPNTLPPILWRSHKRRWRALFSERVELDFRLREPEALPPRHDTVLVAARLLSRIRAQRVAAHLGISEQELEQHRSEAIARGWLTERNRLTVDGRRVARRRDALRSSPLDPAAPLAPAVEYVPRSFRGVPGLS